MIRGLFTVAVQLPALTDSAVRASWHAVLDPVDPSHVASSACCVPAALYIYDNKNTMHISMQRSQLCTMI